MVCAMCRSSQCFVILAAIDSEAIVAADDQERAIYDMRLTKQLHHTDAQTRITGGRQWNDGEIVSSLETKWSLFE